jgi:signal transduction histidine kinase
LAKSQILKTATDDLKTPLTGIIGYADRLLGQRANVGLLIERQQKYVEAISECSHQMAFMIDRLLDVSRIEAGNLDMTPICLEVREEIERTIQNLQTRVQEKRINVLLDVPHSLRPVYADQDRFTQIIKILLTNACEYSHDEALVTVSANETPGFVQIDVTDSGIGIPESSQEKLFTKFSEAAIPFPDGIRRRSWALHRQTSRRSPRRRDMGMQRRRGWQHVQHNLALR